MHNTNNLLNHPSARNSGLPALNTEVSSDVIRKKLVALNSARQSFIQVESSKRIKRALRCKTRPGNSNVSTGDSVFFYRSKKWHGPGKFIGKDGKIIFVRHSGSLYKVHDTEVRLLRYPSMSTPPHDRVIPIPTNETQIGSVYNAELPRECADSENEREEREPNDESVPTTISKDDNRGKDQETGLQSQLVARISDKKTSGPRLFVYPKDE